MTELRVSYPEDVINRIGNYLCHRPWAEVHLMLADLQTKGAPVEASLNALKTADYSDVSFDGSSAGGQAQKSADQSRCV